MFHDTSEQFFFPLGCDFSRHFYFYFFWIHFSKRFPWLFWRPPSPHFLYLAWFVIKVFRNPSGSCVLDLHFNYSAAMIPFFMMLFSFPNSPNPIRESRNSIFSPVAKRKISSEPRRWMRYFCIILWWRSDSVQFHGLLPYYLQRRKKQDNFFVFFFEAFYFRFFFFNFLSIFEVLLGNFFDLRKNCVFCIRFGLWPCDLPPGKLASSTSHLGP